MNQADIKQKLQVILRNESLALFQVVEQIMALFEDKNPNQNIDNQLDAMYFIGVFNVAGIDGTLKELNRLKELNFQPHHFQKLFEK